MATSVEPSGFDSASTAAVVTSAVALTYKVTALVRLAVIERYQQTILDYTWAAAKTAYRATRGPGPVTRSMRNAYRNAKEELEQEAEETQAEADTAEAASRDIGILSAALDGVLTFQAQWAADSRYGAGMRLVRAATAGVVHGALVGGEAYVGALLGDAAGTIAGTVAGAGIGAVAGLVVGGILGTLFVPGLGTVGGAVLGAEVGADVGADVGAALGAAGGAIAGATAITAVFGDATNNVAATAVSGVTNVLGSIF